MTFNEQPIKSYFRFIDRLLAGEWQINKNGHCRPETFRVFR